MTEKKKCPWVTVFDVTYQLKELIRSSLITGLGRLRNEHLISVPEKMLNKSDEANKGPYQWVNIFGDIYQHGHSTEAINVPNGCVIRTRDYAGDNMTFPAMTFVPNVQVTDSGEFEVIKRSK